jgi:hypothetical protein
MAQAIPLALAVGGGALAAGATVLQGQEQARADVFDSTQYSRQEQEYKIAAAQTEARRREELTASLETIAAIRAGRGVGAGSPTEAAIFENVSQDEGRDIRTERLGYLTRAEQARLAATASRRKAKHSLLASYIGAGSQVLTAASRAYTARKT